jgi:hypothetical protein
LCCAKFGFAVAKAFIDAGKKRRLDVRVWECTHLGGDRFAANAIAFPTGHMYGRIEVSDVDNILDSIAADYPYSPCYRGNISLSGPEQLAEAVGYDHCYKKRLNMRVLIDRKIAIGLNRYSITLILVSNSGARSSMVVTCARRDFEIYSSCDDLAQRRMKRVTRWVVESTSALEKHC